jgi:alkylhydroperoxidase family enzyme
MEVLKMARIPYCDIDQTNEEVQATFAKLGAPMNIFRMMAHAEGCFKPFMRVGASMLTRLKLDPKLRELALLHSVRLTGGDYEWVQHVPVAEGLGATRAQISALEAGQIKDVCFNDVERAVLRFTDEVVRNVRASDEALAGIRSHLSDREAVELILMSGFYTTLARLTETMGVENDLPQADEIIGALPGAAKTPGS